MDGSSSPRDGCEAEEDEEGDDDLKSRERPPIVVEEEEDEDLGLRSRSQEAVIWCGVEHTVLGGLA